MKQQNHGFTLMELMIVVVIIGVLAAVAFPSYQDSVRKSRRSDAKADLLALQLAQEKWRATNPSYTANLANLGRTAAGGTFYTPQGFYTLGVAGVSATAYTITATPVAGSDQASDSCGAFSVDQNGPVTTTAAQTACWK